MTNNCLNVMRKIAAETKATDPARIGTYHDNGVRNIPGSYIPESQYEIGLSRPGSYMKYFDRDNERYDSLRFNSPQEYLGRVLDKRISEDWNNGNTNAYKINNIKKPVTYGDLMAVRDAQARDRAGRLYPEGTPQSAAAVKYLKGRGAENYQKFLNGTLDTSKKENIPTNVEMPGVIPEKDRGDLIRWGWDMANRRLRNTGYANS